MLNKLHWSDQWIGRGLKCSMMCKMKVGKSLKHMTETFTRGYRVMERSLL